MESTSLQFRRELSEIVGEENISNTIVSPEPCKIVYLPGGQKHAPEVVVWPRTDSEVSQILKLANRIRVPIITWGGGTDRYSGGIVAPAGSIILTTQRMKRIIAVDTDCLVVTVQSGITIEQLNAELAKYGLWWPHDPESKLYATVGGAVSVNGVGTLVTKFGSAVDSVLGLKVVLPSGEITRFGSYVKQSAMGYNLKDLFTRAEGTLGVITEVTLRVRRIPDSRRYDVAKFDDIRAAVKAAERILDAGLTPETMIIEDYTRFYNTITGIDITRNQLVKDSMGKSKAAMVISFSGSKEFVNFSNSHASEICQQLGGAFMTDRKVAEAWWEAKTEYPPQIPTDAMVKNVAAVEGIADVSVPLKYFPEIYEKFALSLEGSEFFSYGARCYINPDRDGMLSMVVAFEESRPELESRFAQWVLDLSKTAFDLGGTMESITGSGLKLVDHAGYELDKSFKLMRKLKKTLDPNGIMNPGKKLQL